MSIPYWTKRDIHNAGFVLVDPHTFLNILKVFQHVLLYRTMDDMMVDCNQAENLVMNFYQGFDNANALLMDSTEPQDIN